jgi:hypothetical protein
MSESDGQFQAYEVDPEGGYEDAGEGYEEGYEPGDEDILEQLGVIDAYGEVDETRLAEIVENLHAVSNDQAGVADAQRAQAIDQWARDLEHQYPVLRDDKGVYQMLDSAAELLGLEDADYDTLLDLVAEHPEIVPDAVEAMSSGEGQFKRLWRESQEPGHKFWGTGGASSGGFVAG